MGVLKHKLLRFTTLLFGFKLNYFASSTLAVNVTMTMIVMMCMAAFVVFTHGEFLEV